MTGERTASTPAPDSARRAVEAVWRIEAARIVATLTRVTGDFALAEDVAQEALAEALQSWPEAGVPANPGAWLVAVGKRRAIDHWRRQARQDERFAALARDLEDADAGEWDPQAIEDDVLRLIFVACHPVLSREASIALTLRVVGGLTTEEIARAFLVPVSTIQQRIVRAKKTLAAAAIPFEVPAPDAYPARLSAVLSVLYLIFNEGHAASAGPQWMRPDLGREALRLARVLAGLAPREPEAHGLVALLALTAARFPARVDAAGEPVLLADQDRTRWDRGLIRLGRDALARCDALGRGRGPYALQAAIAECHDVAPSVDDTDWERIVLLYEALGRVAPSPIVELNRAVAVSMAEGPAAALTIVDGLSGALAGYAQLPGVRAELLIRLGRTAEARAELERASRLTGNARERAVFERKLAALA
ncbi:RNA polymerase sigma factor [Microbacterium sediminis]|uniref:RNA polymerase sigma factor n=1 Tax=Microbacterium sediminis TaxID=904291 RepID=A0A1B9NDR8_9MICO|nr:RNA polymerase sigma factor [Microbacterium sediminis]OCG74746.1 RNA polymerase subunit sigma-24 [Microbacterium sediminis]QBR75047.1 RNA polymerase sigma factor [Microbacterium sediminis]